MNTHSNASDESAGLPVLVERTFCCPGEKQPISEAVHRGRLASGWAGCAECLWKNDGSNDSPASATPQTRLNIRRTEFGVRGAYLNAIDRFRGAQLAAIFSSHLASVHNDVARLRSAQQSDKQQPAVVDANAPITLAVGFDGCHGTADVFSGVVSAVLQNGCNVVDAGHCTAASLLNVSRRYPHLCGSLLVTGANGESGDVGLDAFDPHGQGIAVPWQNYGVSVRLHQTTTLPTATVLEDETSSLPAANDHRLRNLRQTASTIDAPDTATANSRETFLQLPELHQSGGNVFRAGRQSGSLSAVTTEQFYQHWLLRWWPVHSRQSACFRVHDDRSSERLQWLIENCSLNLEVHRSGELLSSSAVDGAEPAATNSSMSFEIHADDRFLTVRSRRGRVLSVDELVEWINRNMPTSSTHVTAHASPCGRRVLLVDVAAPDTGHQQQVISDGLALAGWILACINNGTNPLPI